MSTGLRLTALLSALLATALGLTWTFLWWAAKLNDWRLVINFDSRGEQWIEGAVLHLVVMFGLWASIRFAVERSKR